MHLDYTYSYLLGDLVLCAFWLTLWFVRSDVRREMSVMSLVFGLTGLAIEPVLRQDWWRPLTVFHTPVGPEDFLFGAAFGGIAAVIYEVVFKKMIRPRKLSPLRRIRDLHTSIALLTISALVFFGLHVAGSSSFVAACTAMIIPSLVIWWYRSDLLVDALASGLIIVFVQMCAFWVVEIVTPGWVDRFWLHEHLSNIVILGAPLEDSIWAFCTGVFIGPLYEFLQESRVYRYNKISGSSISKRRT